VRQRQFRLLGQQLSVGTSPLSTIAPIVDASIPCALAGAATDFSLPAASPGRQRQALAKLASQLIHATHASMRSNFVAKLLETL